MGHDEIAACSSYPLTLSNLLNELSLTLNLSAWWSGTTWLVLALFAGITTWGFWAALAGRPVFKDEILGAGT